MSPSGSQATGVSPHEVGGSPVSLIERQGAGQRLVAHQKNRLPDLQPKREGQARDLCDGLFYCGYLIAAVYFLPSDTTSLRPANTRRIS